MKKLVFGLIATVVFGSLSYGQEKLEERIAKSESFANIQNLNDQILDMKNSDVFIKEFNSDTLKEKGVEYLTDITGYNSEDLERFGNNYVEKINRLIEEFPELTKLNQDNLNVILTNAVNIYSVQNSNKYNPCEGCKRTGRAEMSCGIFVGVMAGIPGGVFGMWGGGTLGFWLGAEHALDCIRTYCY